MRIGSLGVVCGLPEHTKERVEYTLIELKVYVKEEGSRDGVAGWCFVVEVVVVEAIEWCFVVEVVVGRERGREIGEGEGEGAGDSCDLVKLSFSSFFFFFFLRPSKAPVTDLGGGGGWG